MNDVLEYLTINIIPQAFNNTKVSIDHYTQHLHSKHHSYNKIVLACCVWFCLLHAAFITAAAVSLVQNRFLLMNVYVK